VTRLKHDRDDRVTWLDFTYIRHSRYGTYNGSVCFLTNNFTLRAVWYGKNGFLLESNAINVTYFLQGFWIRMPLEGLLALVCIFFIESCEHFPVSHISYSTVDITMMMNSIAKSASRSVARSMAATRTFAAASDEVLVKTSLYDLHKELGGEMVPFAGYELPVLFKGENVTNGGVMKEHLWCRAEGKAALFDVSHMGQVRSCDPEVLLLFWIAE
jgi:hypothetical protein